MKNTKEKLQSNVSALKKNIDSSLIFIIIFDFIYIIVLLIIPFILGLFNVGYFSKITANQMLSYIGSMFSSFCIINLSIMTFSFSVKAKKENKRLMNRTIAEVNKQGVLNIADMGDSKMYVSIPIKIKSENRFGSMDYVVSEIFFKFNKTEHIFIKESICEVIFRNHEEIFDLKLIIKADYEKVVISDGVTVRLSFKVINDGIETPNKLLMYAIRENTVSAEFLIQDGLQIN